MSGEKGNRSIQLLNLFFIPQTVFVFLSKRDIRGLQKVMSNETEASQSSFL